MSSFHKKRQGGYYNQNNYKKKRNFVLEPGIKGFICTCNSREKDCVREAYNILNDYADRLYESQSGSGTESKVVDANDPQEGHIDEEEDVDAALSKEISNLKQGNTKQWRFQVVESGANNCVFIKTTLDDPTELAHFIMTDIDNTKKQRSRFLLRLIPVEATCKAYMDDIRKTAATLFDKYFSKEGKSFAIVFNHRNNNSIRRSDIIEEFAEMIKFRHVDNKVDLSQPQLTFVIEVIRNMCCMSIVPDYFKLLKYNLLELCGKGEKAALEAKKAQESRAEGDSPVKNDNDDQNSSVVENDSEEGSQEKNKEITEETLSPEKCEKIQASESSPKQSEKIEPTEEEENPAPSETDFQK